MDEICDDAPAPNIHESIDIFQLYVLSRIEESL